jgi:predicted N-acyltransferase
MGDREWRALERFYEANADKHGAQMYLRPAFFARIRETHAERVVGTFAFRGDDAIAGALNFERGRHLYGRYWGALEELPMLHFELCYYQLIDRAIARGMTRFEAGAQGEHKLKRGLVPAFTHSAHRIYHAGFAAAIARFVETEAEAVAAQAEEYAAHGPFTRGQRPA